MLLPIQGGVALTVAALAAFATSAQAQPQKQTSFCTPAEKVIFSCRTGARMVSICASQDAAANKGYLQYRFGKPDSDEPLEITLPEARLVPARAATASFDGFSGGGGAWMRFSRGAFGYVAYSGIGNWGPKGEKKEIQGLAVERDGKRIANLKCADDGVSKMGPYLLEELGMERSEKDFDYPTAD